MKGAVREKGSVRESGTTSNMQLEMGILDYTLSYSNIDMFTAHTLPNLLGNPATSLAIRNSVLPLIPEHVVVPINFSRIVRSVEIYPSDSAQIASDLLTALYFIMISIISKLRDSETSY